MLVATVPSTWLPTSCMMTTLRAHLSWIATRPAIEGQVEPPVVAQVRHAREAVVSAPGATASGVFPAAGRPGNAPRLTWIARVAVAEC